MEIPDVLSRLRQLQGLANASKIGLRLSGDEDAAVIWERGADAVEEAIKIIEQTRDLIETMSLLLERR